MDHILHINDLTLLNELMKNDKCMLNADGQQCFLLFASAAYIQVLFRLISWEQTQWTLTRLPKSLDWWERVKLAIEQFILEMYLLVLLKFCLMDHILYIKDLLRMLVIY